MSVPDSDTLLLLSTLASDSTLVIHVSRYCAGLWSVEVSSHRQPYLKGIAEADSLGGALTSATSRFITNRDAPRVVSIEIPKLSGKNSQKISLDDL